MFDKVGHPLSVTFTEDFGATLEFSDVDYTFDSEAVNVARIDNMIKSGHSVMTVETAQHNYYIAIGI